MRYRTRIRRRREENDDAPLIRAEMTVPDDANEVVIRVNRNGPYVVRGPIRLVDADGNEYDVSARKTVSLCRCGGSTTKPFCDGTHSKIGFAGAEQAVGESERRTS